MANQEPTNKEIMSAVVGLKDTVHSVNEKTDQILEAIGLFSNKVEGRFDKLEGKMSGLEGRMDKLEHRMGALDSSVKNYLELQTNVIWNSGKRIE